MKISSTLFLIVFFAIASCIYYQKHSDDRLSLACNTYADMVNLYNANTNYNVSADDQGLIPNINTKEGKLYMGQIILINRMNEACSSTYGLLPRFPFSNTI